MGCPKAQLCPWEKEVCKSSYLPLFPENRLKLTLCGALPKFAYAALCFLVVMLKILELKWVCAEADWKAMVGTRSVICRAHVKQSHTQLLPQQPLLHIPLQDVAIAECQCCQPGWAGTGWGHSCSRGAVPTPSLKALCKCGLGSRCSKTYLYSRQSILFLLAWAP